MLNKIKDLLASSIKKIPASIGTKAIVYYAVVLAAEIILFNIAFCANWWATGESRCKYADTVFDGTGRRAIYIGYFNDWQRLC